MLNLSRNKFRFLVYVMFYCFIGIVIAWNSCMHVKFDESQMISNRLYSKNASTFILQDPTDEDLKILFDTINNNQILWKEDTTQQRGVFYKNGIHLPLISGMQFNFKDNTLSNANQILAGRNINPNKNVDVLGTIGIPENNSSLDDYIFYPLGEKDVSTSKWILDGFNIEQTMENLMQTQMRDKLYLETSKYSGSFNAYQGINFDFVYWLTYISIVLCLVLVTLVRFERDKIYYNICRLTGINVKKIILKVLIKELLLLLMSIILGSFSILLFNLTFIFDYSIIKTILYFILALLINSLISIGLTVYKVKSEVTYDK